MLCLNMAHLGRVAYCFEPMLFRHANLYFSTIISMRKQKRFVSKQGQPRPCTQLKVRLPTEQLKNGLLEATLLGPLLPPRNSSYCYFDTVCKICFSFANLGNTPLASSLFIFLLYLIQIQNKQNKQTVENFLVVVSVVQWLSRPPETLYFFR